VLGRVMAGLHRVHAVRERRLREVTMGCWRVGVMAGLKHRSVAGSRILLPGVLIAWPARVDRRKRLSWRPGCAVYLAIHAFIIVLLLVE
jgi:hypothetical protein